MTSHVKWWVLNISKNLMLCLGFDRYPCGWEHDYIRFTFWASTDCHLGLRLAPKWFTEESGWWLSLEIEDDGLRVLINGSVFSCDLLDQFLLWRYDSIVGNWYRVGERVVDVVSTLSLVLFSLGIFWLRSVRFLFWWLFSREVWPLQSPPSRWSRYRSG